MPLKSFPYGKESDELTLAAVMALYKIPREGIASAEHSDRNPQLVIMQ